MTVHNLGDEPRPVRVDVDPVQGGEASDFDLELDAYGFRWLPVQPEDVRTAP